MEFQVFSFNLDDQTLKKILKVPTRIPRKVQREIVKHVSTHPYMYVYYLKGQRVWAFQAKTEKTTDELIVEFYTARVVAKLKKHLEQGVNFIYLRPNFENHTVMLRSNIPI